MTIIGELPEVNWNKVFDDAESVEVSYLHPGECDRLRTSPRQDLVAVGNTLEKLDRRQAEQLLASLRDLHARRVLLRLQSNTGVLKHSDVMAFGFTRLARLHVRSAVVQYYGFDLYSYKTTPDWLNARYWANPELFDKYRW